MKLEVISITPKEDGSSEFEIKLDQEYVELLKKELHMPEWDNSKFEQFIIKALSNYLYQSQY